MSAASIVYSWNSSGGSRGQRGFRAKSVSRKLEKLRLADRFHPHAGWTFNPEEVDEELRKSGQSQNYQRCDLTQRGPGNGTAILFQRHSEASI